MQSCFTREVLFVDELGVLQQHGHEQRQVGVDRASEVCVAASREQMQWRVATGRLHEWVGASRQQNGADLKVCHVAGEVQCRPLATVGGIEIGATSEKCKQNLHVIVVRSEYQQGVAVFIARVHVRQLCHEPVEQ